MYTKLTFTNSSVLTASNCNQFEENILETRVANIGSGPPNSAELLAGNLWTKTASEEWILNILNNSLQWSPFGTADTASNFATLYGPVYCTNTDGGPYISSQQFNLDSLANFGSWYMIGPTDTGSYDIIWPALDEIPRSVDWIAIRTLATVIGSGTSQVRFRTLAKAYQSSSSPVGRELTINEIGGDTATVTSVKGWSGISTAKIQVNSDNAFELKDISSTTITTKSASLILFGYGYNR